MKNLLKEWLPYVIIIVLVIFIRSYIVTPVVVRGDSMADTLEDGEVLFLNKVGYRFSDIERFDIVVVKDTDGDLIIKRVIGLPGDYVEYKGNKLYINGKHIEDNYSKKETYDFTLQDICAINDIDCNGKIPEDMYLVLGDNREVSADSRVKGLIARKQITGKAVFRIWPLNKIKIVK